MNIGEGNMRTGTVREVRAEGDLAVIRIQFGDNIVESVMTKAMAEDMGIKAGDPVTAMIETTRVRIEK